LPRTILRRFCTTDNRARRIPCRFQLLSLDVLARRRTSALSTGRRPSGQRGNAHGPPVAATAFKKIAVLPVRGGMLYARKQQPVAIETILVIVALFTDPAMTITCDALLLIEATPPASCAWHTVIGSTARIGVIRGIEIGIRRPTNICSCCSLLARHASLLDRTQLRTRAFGAHGQKLTCWPSRPQAPSLRQLVE